MNSLRYIGGQVDTIVEQLAGDLSSTTGDEQQQRADTSTQQRNQLYPNWHSKSPNSVVPLKEPETAQTNEMPQIQTQTQAPFSPSNERLNRIGDEENDEEDDDDDDEEPAPSNDFSISGHESDKDLSDFRSSDDEDQCVPRQRQPSQSPLLPFADEEYIRPPLWKVVLYLVFFQWHKLAEVLRSGAVERSGPPGDRTARTFVFTPDLELLAEPPAHSMLKGSVSSPIESSSVELKRNLTNQRRRRRASSRSSITLLKSPLSWRDTGRKTLVLDLDETLIHTMARNRTGSSARMIEVEFNTGIKCIYFVEKRPFCDYFLSTVNKWFDLVIYTASVQSYADPMIDWLDPWRKYFVRRLYRSDCVSTNSGYVKDLSRVRDDLGRVMIIDNSPISFQFQKNNGISIEGWIADPSDQCLIQLLPLLNALRLSTDVRSVLCLQHGEAFASDPAFKNS